MTIDQGGRQPDQIAEEIDELLVDVSAEARTVDATDPVDVSDRLRASIQVCTKRRHRWRPRFVALLVTADLTAALIASVTAYFARSDDPYSLNLSILGRHVSYLELGVATALVWPVLLYLGGAYRAVHLRIGPRDLRAPLTAGFQLVGGVALLSFALKTDLSRMIVLVYLPVLIGSVLILRSALFLALRSAQSRGIGRARLLVVGEGEQVRRLVSLFGWSPRFGYDIVGVCTPGVAPSLRVRGRDFGVLGAPDDLIGVARRVGVDAVAVANPAGFVEMTFQRVTWQLERSGIDVLVAPDLPPATGPRVQFAPIMGLPLLHVEESRRRGLWRSVHAHASRILAIPLLVLAFPVMLAVGLAVLIDSGRPLFYRQARVGYMGREFRMFKFRTMVPGAETLLSNLVERNERDGALFKIRDDPRVTRIGRFLRRYSLDELPQLLNVVTGDMALVGPRPCLASETSQFGEAELRRFLVKPGMTGLWQVYGRTDLPWEDGAALDLRYVDSWSPLLDLRILWMTLVVVIRGTGC